MTHQALNTLRKLFTAGQPIRVEKNEIILGNELEPNGVYFICSGYIKVYSVSDMGDEYLHIIYGRDEIFPLNWMFLGTHPDALFYQAISDCVLWRMSGSRLHDIVLNNIKISYALNICLARQFRVFSDRVDNLEYRTAQERVVYRLLFLASRFGVRDGRMVTIDAPITHEIFANSINLARESVSRHLEKLEQQNIIRRYDHHILILDVPRLAKKLSRPGNLTNWGLL
jgi:CRP/FNR family transcriptional regulator, cyclic AMP receptor protein